MSSPGGAASRRVFLKAAAASAVARGRAFAARAERRPNFVLIFGDQWRAQAAGYAGDSNAQTPALDRLAAESANFVNAVSGLPVCCPYRGSLVTGQYPLTNGVFINDVPLVPRGKTFGEAFQDAGYQTGYIGKWHLFGSPGGKNERRQSFIPPDKRFGFEYWKANECSHNYLKSPYYEGNDRTMHYWKGYDAIAQAGDACGFISRHARSADPFLLMVSLGPPHSPYGTAPQTYRAVYEERELQYRPNVPADWRQRVAKDMRGYYAHIAALDDCIGRVLDTIQKAGIAEDTIFLFTADHGDMMGSQGLMAKHHPWDESIRVPCLVRYPRKLGNAGRQLRFPIDAPDIMPTVLGLAGIPVPGPVQGRDLSKMLTGASGAGSGDDAALLTLPASFFAAQRCGWAEYRGLRTEQYTYVRSIYGPWLLYDNESDRYQMHNLCGKPEHKAVQNRLDKALEARLKRVNDDFLPGRTYLERAGLTHYREVNMPYQGCVSPWDQWGPTMKR